MHDYVLRVCPRRLVQQAGRNVSRCGSSNRSDMQVASGVKPLPVYMSKVGVTNQERREPSFQATTCFVSARDDWFSRQAAMSPAVAPPTVWTCRLLLLSSLFLSTCRRLESPIRSTEPSFLWQPQNGRQLSCAVQSWSLWGVGCARCNSLLSVCCSRHRSLCSADCCRSKGLLSVGCCRGTCLECTLWQR